MTPTGPRRIVDVVDREVDGRPIAVTRILVALAAVASLADLADRFEKGFAPAAGRSRQRCGGSAVVEPRSPCAVVAGRAARGAGLDRLRIRLDPEAPTDGAGGSTVDDRLTGPLSDELTWSALPVLLNALGG